MKKITLCLLFIFLSVCAFSQTANERPKDIKDNPQYLKALEMEKIRSNNAIQVSEYFGLENKITDVLLNNSIPSSFPRSLTYSDKTMYVETVNAWLKQNPSFVKADKKNVIITE